MSKSANRLALVTRAIIFIRCRSSVDEVKSVVLGHEQTMRIGTRHAKVHRQGFVKMNGAHEADPEFNFDSYWFTARQLHLGILHLQTVAD